MEFCRCSLFVTFEVLTVDQFVVRDDGLFEQQKQDSHVLSFLDFVVFVVTTLIFH